MKKTVLLFLSFALLTSFHAISQKGEKTITGKVSDGQNPIKNVLITVKGTEQNAYTDETGTYQIKSSIGDVLVYSYTGLRSLEILVEDVTRTINLRMFPDVAELDEVVVTKSKRKSQQDLEIAFNTNPYLVRSAYGIIDPETAAFQVRVLPATSIQAVGLCILDVLRNEFPGVSIIGDCLEGGSVSVRGVSSISNNQPAIFDVDGQIFTDVPIWLAPGNMERIALMSGLAARNLYGAIASGGVVVINTNVGNAYAKSGEIQDKMRLRDNLYQGDARTQKALLADRPTYYQEIYASNSLETAKQTYRSFADRYKNSYAFFVDAYSIFSDKWNATDFAESIVVDNFKVFDGNPLAMKSLAFNYEAQGAYEKANTLYKEVFLLRPTYAQSYLDVAESYRQVGAYKKAAAMFIRYDYLVQEGFMKPSEEAFSMLMDRELNNLITIQGKDVLPETKPKNYLLEEDFDGTRLVFEWSDSEAEFELQLVNPLKNFQKWQHTLADNEATIRDEKLKGYATKEYLIDGSLSGDWLVNVNYIGNKSLTPTYLKATIYYNYGQVSQREEVKVFKLGLKGVNQQLFRVRSSGKVAVN